jgi:hypothetical protein
VASAAPPEVTPSKLVKVAFQMDCGKPFDVWIDDMKFLECKK